MNAEKLVRRTIVLLVVISLLATACAPVPELPVAGQQADQPEGALVVTTVAQAEVVPTSTPPPEPTTIVWATWGGAAQAELYEQAIEKFHAAQDRVRVENINSASAGDHVQKVQTMIGGGTPPDLIMLGGETVPAFAANGATQPIDRFVEEDPTFSESDYFGVTLDAMRYEGKLWGLPKDFNITILYYNKNMFDEAGLDYPTRDWDQQTFLDAAQALTKREDGRVVQYGFADAPLNMWYWIWQNGGEIFDNDTNPSVMLMDEPAALETVKWYFDLSLVHGVAPSLPELMQSGGQQELFAGGRVAMLADLRGATQILNQITDFEWGMTELPQGKEGRATVFNWAGYSITAGSAHPDAAWEFLKWIAGPEGVRVFIEGGNSLPAIQEMVEDSSLGIQQPFIDSIPYARPFFASPKWSDLLPTMLQYLQGMAVGQMSVEEAVPAMKAAVDPILAH